LPAIITTGESTNMSTLQTTTIFLSFRFIRLTSYVIEQPPDQYFLRELSSSLNFERVRMYLTLSHPVFDHS
jgi:hypothetical protein